MQVVQEICGYEALSMIGDTGYRRLAAVIILNLSGWER